MTNIKNILAKLDIEKTGFYKDHAYIINLDDSTEYARLYTILDKNAVNTEFPDFVKNTADSTIQITNYFEIYDNNIPYDLFLSADFDEDKYYLKITERAE